MVFYVSKDLKIINSPEIINSQISNYIKIVPDTEFTQKNKMVVDIIGVYVPNISSSALVYATNDLNKDFHPIIKPLKDLGINISLVEKDTLIEKIEELALLFDELTKEVTSRKIKKVFLEALNTGYFDNFLNSCNLTRKTLGLCKDSSEYFLTINPKPVEVVLEFFFQPADLFKIWGKNHQEIILTALIQQFRVIKSKVPISIYVLIEKELCELKITFSDSFHRIPPLSDRSLNGNAKALGLSAKKVDIKTDDLAIQLGLESWDDVMKNFTILLDKMPELAITYNAQDLYLSDYVSNTQQLLLSKLREDFNLEESKISDTTGSNVSKFIVDLLFLESGVSKENKEEVKLLKELLKLSQIKNLQEIPFNNFGIQPFLTVGGLLFTRTALNPVIKGNLSDCDLSSCYATYMSSMSIYLGEPIVRTFKYQKYKPTLREIVEFVKENKPPRDGWFCRVTGCLNQAVNTLVMSDLRFEPKPILCPTLKDIRPSRKSIEQFNAFKTPKKQASSTVLTKEIKFGLINSDILDCLELLPKEWFEEYLNLKVDALIYHPSELICEDVLEVLELRKTLPDEHYSEEFNPKQPLANPKQQYCKNNVTLKFDIGYYWNLLRNKRKDYKKAKNPVQEIYKLFGNSGYGVLACLNLATNNLVASNAITAGARSAAWLMTNALNGFAPITDGTSFSWDNIPTNKNFKDILSNNPNYLFQFDSEIISNLSTKQIGQKWIDENFKSHLYSFYGVDESHIPANRFDFELKEEIFIDTKGKEIKTIFFTTYHNTNAGNYSKGMKDCTLLIDGTNYDFVNQNNFVKARSFKGKNNNLINWYIQSLNDKYESPFIYSENKLIKFADGCDIAIRVLESSRCEEIVLPCGFGTTSYKAMKLISRSQFLFQNEKQLKNFETNEQKLSELSKEIFNKSFWERLKNDDLKDYDVELIPNYDYYTFSKTHSVGIGFELLALTRTHKNSIESVRKEIQNKILEGCLDFNAALNIRRNYKLGEKFKYLLAAMIVLKANAEEKLINTLIDSVGEPTLLTVRKENIKTLEEIRNNTEED